MPVEVDCFQGVDNVTDHISLNKINSIYSIANLKLEYLPYQGGNVGPQEIAYSDADTNSNGIDDMEEFFSIDSQLTIDRTDQTKLKNMIKHLKNDPITSGQYERRNAYWLCVKNSRTSFNSDSCNSISNGLVAFYQPGNYDSHGIIVLMDVLKNSPNPSAKMAHEAGHALVQLTDTNLEPDKHDSFDNWCVMNQYYEIIESHIKNSNGDPKYKHLVYKMDNPHFCHKCIEEIYDKRAEWLVYTN